MITIPGDSAYAAANPFQVQWNTANTSAGSSSSTQITLPLESGGSYNFWIDWGDGNSDHITAYNQAAVTHTYSASGIYVTQIVGKFKGLRFNATGDKLKILDIQKWGCFKFNTVSTAFGGCTNMIISATDMPFIGGVNSMAQIFNNCSAITTFPNFGLWNTAAATSFFGLFNGCTNFNEPSISSLNVLNVTDISVMLASNTAFNQDISAWNICKVTSATSFFTSGSLSKANYNKLLATWSAITSPQVPRSNVTIQFGNSHYDSSTGGYDGTAGRAILTGTYGWIITDGGTP